MPAVPSSQPTVIVIDDDLDRPAVADVGFTAAYPGQALCQPSVRKAFVAIGAIFGRGGGIVHSVSGVARARSRASGAPWIQLPAIVFPSGLSLPS